MKKLYIIIFIFFFNNGFAQNLEMDAELIELNFHFSSDPTDFFHFQNQLFFRGKYKGLDDYTIFNYDGEEIEFMKNSEGERILSTSPAIGENLMYFLGKTESDFYGNFYLWVSHGVENNAIPLTEPGTSISDLFVVGDRLFFINSDSNGEQLWTSNGTVETTIQLKPLHWTAQNGWYVKNLVASNGKLYFLTDDPTYGEELWISDGTVAGTHMVKDIRGGEQGSRINGVFSFNNKVYFAANNGTDGFELWVSDGTQEGTNMLKNIRPGNESSLGNFENKFIVFGGNFYFYANNGTNVQLWKSDGTTNGTVFFKNVNIFQGNAYYQTASINGEATDSYFVFKAFSYDNSNNQYTAKLWKSDGTNAGTIEISDIEQYYSPFTFSQFDTVQDKVYLTTESTYPNRELWVTDGTSQGTNSVTDGYQEYSYFKSEGNNLFLKAKISHNEFQVLKVDYNSNASSIFLENTINPERGFEIFNDEIYFGFDYNYGNNYHNRGSELWKSDLGGNNPILVKDINLANSSFPQNFYKIYDKTIFYAYNNKDYGLFMSDGTVNGTNFLKDITIETSYYGETKTTFFPIGNQYFFRGKLQEEFAPDRLFKTNGTSEGTTMVSDEVELDSYHHELYEEFNGKLFFVGKDTFIGVNGHDLWASDGTNGGTNRVYNLPNDSKIISMKSFGDYLYFTIIRGSEGREVWRTDGTTSGTESVFIAPYEYWQNEIPPFILGEINDKLIFSNTNDYYAQYPDSYIELYSINQENGEPQNFFTMDARPYFQFNLSGWYQSINYQNKLFVPIMLYEGDDQFKLSFLKTDGTTEGTHVLGPLPLDALSIENLTKCGDYLYFTEGYSPILSLWRTNGENGGTVKLRSIGDDYENISDIVCHKNNLYYSLYTYSTEISDYIGTLEVTNGIYNQHQEITIDRVDDEPINQINELYSDGNLLYLTISEGIHGVEPYVANPDIVLSTEEINEGLANNNQNVLIYPNPTSSEINVISNDQSKIKQIQIYDLTGKLIEIGIYNSNEVKINLGKYNSGIYLLKVNTEKNTTTKKVVVK